MIRACRSCGESIADAEFKQHRAVRIMKRDYCGACADRITRRKTPFHVLALPAIREHPLLATAVAISVLLAAILFALLSGRPPA